MKIPHLISKQNVCNNKNKKCYHLPSYNNMEILRDKDSSKKEKDLNLKKYNSSCDNRGGILDKCCLKKMDSRDEKIINKKKIYGKTEYNKKGELESIKLCKYNSAKKCKDYKLLTPYEVCKIPSDYVNIEEVEITDFTKDCYNVQCNPQEKLVSITGDIQENYTYDLDKKISLSIENNNLKNIKIFIGKDRKLLSRVLTHNSDGNTIYHEALKYNADKILIYLIKMMPKNIINNLNVEGDSLLHLALNNNNPTIIRFCFRLGANINLKNNKQETPIYNAIRSGIYNNVLKCINNNADIYVKNINGDTPFVVACITKNGDISIVKLLVENGANIEDKTKYNNNVIEYFLKKSKLTIKQEEIRTYLQNMMIKKLNLDTNKKLSIEETKKLKNILYVREDKDKYKKYEDFNIEIDFDENLEYPNDLHYEKDLEENYMKPYNLTDMNYSHEPYYQKYKNLQKDRLQKLKKTIKLSEWDNNNSKDKKEQIIDDIMNNKKDFESYKYEVLNQNGLKEEQLHLLGNLDDNNIFSEKEMKKEKKLVSVKAKNDTNNNKNNPKLYNIKKNIKLENKKDNVFITTIDEEIKSEDNLFKVLIDILKDIDTLVLICIVLVIIIFLIVFIYTRKNRKFRNIISNYG